MRIHLSKCTVRMLSGEVKECGHSAERQEPQPTGDGGIILAGVGAWSELPRGSSIFLVGDVISCDACSRGLPGEGDGVRAHRSELDVGWSLDHWFSYKNTYST